VQLSATSREHKSAWTLPCKFVSLCCTDWVGGGRAAAAISPRPFCLVVDAAYCAQAVRLLLSEQEQADLMASNIRERKAALERLTTLVSVKSQAEVETAVYREKLTMFSAMCDKLQTQLVVRAVAGGTRFRRGVMCTRCVVCDPPLTCLILLLCRVSFFLLPFCCSASASALTPRPARCLPTCSTPTSTCLVPTSTEGGCPLPASMPTSRPCTIA